jgi:hypothetical protein
MFDEKPASAKSQYERTSVLDGIAIKKFYEITEGRPNPFDTLLLLQSVPKSIPGRLEGCRLLCNPSLPRLIYR